ncbi:uncharacterized protein LOC135348282 isoform X2 [Halichondria panicea]|uniref:uncharacterized protein LOC135348282 isoform X2 n=1 Tax=Halichondria panicea TaxID=6063 RepID=UPI00312B9515
MTMFFTSLLVISTVIFVEASEVYLNVKSEACSERARVKLICEGVDLVGLRWRYSSPNSTEYVNILEILVDASWQIFLSNITNNNNPAFLSVQLVNISRSLESNMENYSSILTVDLLALEKQNITSITCGDVITYIRILVSDIIVWDPVNTIIIAIYQFGVLTSVKVQLRNLLICSSILMYTVTINGSDEVKIMKTCVGLFCEARFSSIRTIMGEHNIELSLFNTRSSRINTKMYASVYVIGLKSEDYFRTQVNSTNCLYSVSCAVIQNDSTCTIQHTTLSNQPPINGTEVLKIPHSSPGTVHTFAFSMKANKNLLIKENMSVTDGIPVEFKSTAILSTTSLYLFLTVIHFLLLLIGGTQCSPVRMTLRDSMLDTMLVISCLGITILITIWSFIGHGVYNYRKFTLRFENKDTCIVTTPSRKSPSSTLPKQSKSGQHSNSVLYDEVDLAKVKGNVSDMIEVELKANESYGHTDKSITTACPTYATPECNSQKDLSLSHQYSKIKVKPKAKRMSEHPELINIEQEQILLKSNQSYGQLTGVVGQIGGCELLHEYDYVDPLSQ